jgi:flagellar protein FliO/FliZ
MKSSIPARQHTFLRQVPTAFSAWLAILLFPAFPAQAAEKTAPGLLSAGNQETISLTATIFKAMGSLIIVLAVMFLLLYLIKKSGLVRNAIRQGGLINVLDLRVLAPRKQVAVLEVAGEYIVIGISDQQITLLHTLESSELLRQSAAGRQADTPSLPPAFAAFLHRAGRRVRGEKKEGGPHAS